MGQRLKFHRLRKGLSVKEVAANVGVPLSTYREWENGRLIQGEPYQKIAEVFQIGIVELITGHKPTSAGIVQKLDLAMSNLEDLRKTLLSNISN